MKIVFKAAVAPGVNVLFNNIDPADLPPRTPSNLVATRDSDTQITITWQDNSDFELGFKIERGPSAIFFTEIADVGADTELYVDTDVIVTDTWFYRVLAYNANGNSGYSNVDSA